jgi:hypothetical protein
MSSISISHPFPSQDNNDHNSPFSFPFASQHIQDGSSSGATFVVNPASAHPPEALMSLEGEGRRERKSSRYSHVGGEKSTRASITEVTAYGEEAEMQVAESVPNRKSKGRVRLQEVWKEMFLTSNGRDKALVCTLRNITEG